MMSTTVFRKICLALEGAIEQPHFEKTSFRVSTKIFATLEEKNLTAVVKLSAIDQSVFCAIDKTVIYPVPGGWGKQGWTMVELKKVKTALLKDLLTTAYCTVAPEKLAAKYKQR